MDLIFVDTCYWIALINNRDGLHKKATDLRTCYANCILVTSELILIELLNSFSGQSGKIKKAVIKAVLNIQNNSQVDIIPHNEQLFSEAFSWYRKYTDKNWSFIDCSSFVIMENRNIERALTYDRHFCQAGFKALLRE